MHKILWISDIHLDFLSETVFDKNKGFRITLSESRVENFCKKCVEQTPDSVLITGDISTAPNLETHLGWLEKYIPNIPIYFVLGNHDFYHGSISEIREKMKKYDSSSRIQYLSQMGVVKLTETTALIGHDGWYDGGYSDWFKSKLIMNEYLLTKEFIGETQKSVYNLITGLAQECEDHINKYVPEAIAAGFKRIMIGTHVPPFRENSRAPDGNLSDINWLPNMSSKKAGDALLKQANSNKKINLVCLSGHTHTSFVKTYGTNKNIVCMTGKSEYNFPEKSIQIISVE